MYYMTLFLKRLLAVKDKSMLNRITFIDKTGREVIKTVFNSTNIDGKIICISF